MDRRGSYSDTFILRIWREASSANWQGDWRGYIEHVRSGTGQGFQNMRDLTTFLEQWLADGALKFEDNVKGGDVLTKHLAV